MQNFKYNGRLIKAATREEAIRQITASGTATASARRARAGKDGIPVTVGHLGKDGKFTIEEKKLVKDGKRWTEKGADKRTAKASAETVRLTIRIVEAEAYEDYWEKGEGAYVNRWDYNEAKGKSFSDVKSLVDYLNDRCCYLPDSSKKQWCMIEEGEDGTLRLSNSYMADYDNDAVDTEKDTAIMEQFKAGEVKLFAIHLDVYADASYTAPVPESKLEEMCKSSGVEIY